MTDTKEPSLDGYTKAHQARSLDRMLDDMMNLSADVRRNRANLAMLRRGTAREEDALDWDENNAQDPERFDFMS